MGGRQFNQRNSAPPACVEEMALKVPPCFDRKMWRLWVEDSYRLVMNDKAGLARITRGEIPNYCEECTLGHQAKMLAAKRCFPPAAAHCSGIPPAGVPVQEPLHASA